MIRKFYTYSDHKDHTYRSECDVGPHLFFQVGTHVASPRARVGAGGRAQSHDP
jgi:hypothetical protein